MRTQVFAPEPLTAITRKRKGVSGAFICRFHHVRGSEKPNSIFPHSGQLSMCFSQCLWQVMTSYNDDLTLTYKYDTIINQAKIWNRKTADFKSTNVQSHWLEYKLIGCVLLLSETQCGPVSSDCPVPCAWHMNDTQNEPTSSWLKIGEIRPLWLSNRRKNQLQLY